jgi:uncharacterized protein (TIGR03435 family)
MIRFAAVAVFLSFAALSFAQPAPAAFEVASIKLSDDPPGNSGWSPNPGRLLIRNMSLKGCIMAAYHLQDFQITGGPAWLDSDRYYIDARTSVPASQTQLLEMLQPLLAERFHLAFHRETKEATGYALVVDKKAVKIQPDEAAQYPTVDARRDSMAIRGMSMESLARSLSHQIGAPVVDATGLSGVFSFTLKWTPDAGDAPGPYLPGALRETAGLDLQRRKVPVEVFVVDQTEKPTQ